MAHDTKTLLEYLFDFGLDLRDRRVIMQGPIGLVDFDEPAGKLPTEHVIRSLLYLDKTEGGIELWLDTPGGEVDQMWAIYDVVRSCANKVTTVGFGQVYSAGVLLLAAGDVRTATPNCWMMAHEDQLEVEGPQHTIDAFMTATKRQGRIWYDRMGDHTNHSSEWWQKEVRNKREIWWDARQMKHHGIIDSIRPHTEARP